MEKYLINVSGVLNKNEIKNVDTSFKLDKFILRASDVRTKKLNVRLKIEPIKIKDTKALLISGKITGVLILSCHRCVENFEHPFDLEVEQLFTKKQDFLEESMLIENNEIDLIPIVKESLSLNLPIKFLCEKDCKGLCPGCGKNLNKEPCLCEKKPIDIRWQKLSEYFKNEKDG